MTKSGQPLFRVDFQKQIVRYDSPGMLEQLHQKAVPTPTFQLNLGPCHFTSGFSLKGVLETDFKLTSDVNCKLEVTLISMLNYT